MLLQPKIFLQQPNVLWIELNILLLQQNIFAIPILTNDFVGISKPFIPCYHFLNTFLSFQDFLFPQNRDISVTE